jgi:chromosome segregation ATPase
MNILQRLTKAFDRTSGRGEEASRIAQIHNELSDVRMSIRLLEMHIHRCDPDHYEADAQQINALREREHALIKEAKRLCGEEIRIAGSLREHAQDQGTNVPVQVSK